MCSRPGGRAQGPEAYRPSAITGSYSPAAGFVAGQQLERAGQA